MKRVRMIDPLVRATSFAARRGGMRDAKKLDRRLQKVEQRVAPVREDVITPEDWSQIEEVETQPEVDEDIVGRIFLTRNEDADDVLSAGITAADGEPVLVGLSTIGNVGAFTIAWQSLITGLASISGVAVDASGNIYAAYSTNIRKYSLLLVAQWTSAAGATGAVGLRHIASDGTKVLVSGTTFAQYVIFNRLASTGAAGAPATFGASGTANGEFGTSGPRGEYFDGTHVWVADQSNHRVQKFLASTGAYVSQFDGSSSGLAFDLCYDICADPSGTYLYVLDSTNGRIVKFDKATHAFVAEFVLGNGSADGQISAYAEGIGVDSQGRIWVADTGNHRVQVYDSAGEFLAKVGSYGTGTEQFKNPKQIAVSSSDIVYVADFDNNRIVTLSEFTGLPLIRSTVGGTVASGASATVDATCLTGEHVISGGHKHLSGNQNINNHESYPVNSTTWRCSSFNGTAGNVATMITCYAMCVKD